MNLRCLVPGGIATRIAMLLLLAMLVTQAISGLLYLSDRGERAPLRGPATQVHRIGAIVRLLDATSEDTRSGLVAALGGPGLTVAWELVPPPFPVPQSMRTRFLAMHLREEVHDSDRAILIQPLSDDGVVVPEPADSGDPAAVGRRPPLPPPPQALAVAVALSDGSWVRFTLTHPDDSTFRLVKFAIWMVLIGLTIVLLSWLMARRLTSPLARFAAAADRLGRDVSAAPLAETGPSEVRQAIAAFNRMQERLRRYIADRTQMLAAMSHDLRTPLTRLRLRAEFVEDVEQQRKMLEDLDQMEQMITATLAFAREDARNEARADLDLAALLQSLCDDAADIGREAAYEGPEHRIVACRPIALRRALGNLLDNALFYGGNARVSLVERPGQVAVRIDDDGPGIPASEQEKVFAPFYRLERSRSRDTGGTGLGLAVARTFARAQGGDVMLGNRREGGLRVELAIPDET
ncbi:MAG: ATP-binding protein [Azospirillaceae bacterium]|nr:ATP-binding protein [Azospirillaceae bacterium]